MLILASSPYALGDSLEARGMEIGVISSFKELKMKLKNILKSFAFAGLMVVAGIGLAHAESTVSSSAGLCPLIAQLQDVFRTLRTLAFIGAAFMLAGWAWGYISSGESKLSDLKQKGIALLVGFTILFAVGALLQFVVLGQVENCVLTGW